MATELKTKLQYIQNEKNQKILPENIKKGVKIFGVEGDAGIVVDNGINIEKIINWTEGTYCYVPLPKENTYFRLYARVKEGATLPNDLYFGLTEYGDYTDGQNIRWWCTNGVPAGGMNIGNDWWYISNKLAEGYMNYIAIYPISHKATIADYLEIKLVEITNSDVQEIEITPTMEDQIEEGLYNKVTVKGDANLLAENIKKDVQIFGVTGSLEQGSGGTVEGIKQFATEEEMQADASATEGDLAVIYSQDITNMTATTETQTITFPQTVILPEAFTDSVYTMLRAVDDSAMFDAQVMLDSTMFDFNAYTESGSIQVQYESSDGITYTRTDGGDETIDCGTPIKCYYEEEWNDTLGYFMQVSSMYFGGLHKYSSYLDKSMFRFVKLSDITITDNVAYWNGNYDETAYDVEKLKSLYLKMYNDGITSNQRGYFALNENNQLICFSYYFASTGKINGNAPDRIVHNGSGCIGLSNIILSGNNDPSTIYVYALDLENQTYTKIMETSNQGTISISGSNYYTYPVILNSVPIYWAGYENDIEYKLHPIWITSNLMDNATGTACNVTNVANNINLYETKYEYFLAPTQLTVTAGDVLDKKFYGVNGVENGTLGNLTGLTNEELVKKVELWDKFNDLELSSTDATGLFEGSNIRTIPLLDTKEVTNMKNMFKNCSNLEEIPEINTSEVTNMESMFESTHVSTIPLLDTSKVTNMGCMFRYCMNLDHIPLIDTGNVTDMRYMFNNCNDNNFTTIPLLDTKNVTTMYNTFLNCSKLVEIPLLDTSSVSNMNETFAGCTSLVTIPQLDTRNVTLLMNTFGRCTSLSDESLNNILQMLILATGYTGLKTLKTVGLTSEQATKCTTLSNYQAFLDAGWTTGY